jgi:predicted metal-binding membrane protein
MTHITVLAVMWAGMMAAMMVPAAAPSTVLHARMSRSTWLSAAYATGYLGAWAVVGIAYAAAHWALQAAGLLHMGMRLASAPVAGAVLIAAGAYQWSPLKARCVARCRSPLGFMLNEWRDGTWGAFTMGLRYATWCVGCCWMLMAVLFVVGAMSITWAAVISLYVLAERLVSRGHGFDRMIGAALAAWGVWTIVAALGVF